MVEILWEPKTNLQSDQRNGSQQNQRITDETKCWLDAVEDEHSFGKSYGQCMGETNKVCLCYTFTSSEDTQYWFGWWNTEHLFYRNQGNHEFITSCCWYHQWPKVTLSLTNLLTMKSKVIMLPPGEFSWPDICCRRQWRRVQHLSNGFWSR